MGRGDDNILFNEKLLQSAGKKDRRAKMTQRGSFGSSAAELTLAPSVALLKDMGSGIHLFDDKWRKRDNGKIPNKIPYNSKVSLGPGKVAMGDSDGIAIHSLGQDMETLYTDNLPGNLLGLHLNKDTLYCLAEEADEVSLFVTSANKRGGWKRINEYGNRGFSVERKGDVSLLLEIDPRQRLRLSTLSARGEGRKLTIDAKEIPHHDPKRLIAPVGGSEDDYFALLRKEDGGLELTRLYLESFTASSRANRESLVGIAAGEKIIGLEKQTEIESVEFKDLVSSYGRGLLLGDRELILFDREGLVQAIPLDPRDSELNRISFVDDRALLWQEGYGAYQEFSLPR